MATCFNILFLSARLWNGNKFTCNDLLLIEWWDSKNNLDDDYEDDDNMYDDLGLWQLAVCQRHSADVMILNCRTYIVS